MFGLALGTTGVWSLVDAAWFAGGETLEYRAWARRFSLILYSVGIAWFAAAGSWYVFGTWDAKLQATMFHWPWIVLTVATALAPALPWLLLWRTSGQPGRRGGGAGGAGAVRRAFHQRRQSPGGAAF